MKDEFEALTWSMAVAAGLALAGLVYQGLRFKGWVP